MLIHRYLLALAALCATSNAAAICSEFTHIRVGDTATDHACGYNDIQSAIDAVGSTCPVVIDVTREHLYGSGGFCTPGQSGGCHLTIADKNVTLQGWGDGITCTSFNTGVCQICGPGQSVPLVTLDGASSGGPVLSITGTSHVTLNNLTITHGNAGGNGGGIAFGADGSLALNATTVNFNEAMNGGGIDFNGIGSSAASLTLGANSLILFNTASGSGGGVRVEGNARLFALQPQTLIGYNHAPNGYGGGVQVVGPARADIGSPGYGSGGVIFYNDAMYGGGLSLYANGESDPKARLFSIDAGRPARISQNTASHTGGAVHMMPSAPGITSFGAPAELCAYGFRLDGNIAQEGTAIYGDTQSTTFYGSQSSQVVLDHNESESGGSLYCSGDSQSIADLGAVPCTGNGCNTIDGNVAEDGNAQPTPGAAILIQNGGELQSTALALRGNHGAHAVRTLDVAAQLSNCLAVDGVYSAAPFQFENQGGLGGGPGTETLQNCTIANNSIGSGDVIASGYGLKLHDSIIAQPGVASLDYTGNAGDLDIQYVMSNNISTLPGGNDVVVGVPTFVNSANGDYHLANDSYGLDFAPPIAGDDRDLDGLPHDQDLPTVANVYGPRDLGAYERQNLFRECGTSDSIFCDGFEP